MTPIWVRTSGRRRTTLHGSSACIRLLGSSETVRVIVMTCVPKNFIERCGNPKVVRNVAPGDRNGRDITPFPVFRIHRISGLVNEG